jgi:macrolide transport system ATP-binding/permease protein
MSAPLIELHGLSRRYVLGDQELYALRDIDLEIHAGEMVALMGASGSGKSTLLNILGCLDRPSSGVYRVDGRETTSLDPVELAALRRDRFGFIFQRYNLLPQLTARANVEIPAIYAGVAEEARHMRARKLLARLGLGERLDHRPNQLSGGQQQRVSIARALMNGGAIILADEPTGALDSRTGREMMEVLLDLNRRGHTLIIATHDPHVAGHARRVVEIEDGRVIRDEETEGAAPASPPSALDDMLAPLPSAGAAALWPRLAEAMKMAWFALLGQRLRTALTLLGVIIGIVSVVMMVALGESSQRVLREQLKDMPANFLEIAPGKFFGDPDAAKTQGLTAADVDVLRRQGFVYSISPEVTATAMLRLGSVNSNATVTGGNEDYFETSGLRFDLGASFSGQDVSAQRQVVVIDTNVRKRFFGDQNPLGKIINVGKLPCIVIGVVAKNLTMESLGAANRLDVYMPFTTVGARLLGYSRLNFVEMRFREGLPGEAVERGVEDILKRRHHVKDFSMLQYGKMGAIEEGVHRHDDLSARRDRPRLAHRRRHWRDEHHAGVGVRARARDRHKDGGRRAPIRRARAVPHGGRRRLSDRRRGRGDHLLWRELLRQFLLAKGVGANAIAWRHRRRGRERVAHRHNLWLYSRAQRIDARSGGGALS